MPTTDDAAHRPGPPDLTRAPDAGFAPLPLLERDDALAQLQAMLADVHAGRGRCAVIRAPAGLGKTRLVSTLAEQVAARAQDTGEAWRWLQAGCDGLHTPRPLGPLVDLAPRLPGFLGDALHAGQTYNGLFPTLLGWLSGDTPPAMLVIEDLHWADEATLDAVRYLGRRIATAGFGLLLTLRPQEPGESAELRPTLAALDAGATLQLDLKPLSAQAVAQVAVQRGREPGRLFELTAGNPLFLQQLLAVPEGQVPGSLRDAVLAETTALDPATLAAVHTLSLAPGGLPVTLLLDLHPDAQHGLDAGPARRLLRLQPPTLAFEHDLARQIVCEALPPLERWQGHRRLYTALSALPEAPGRSAMLLHHAEAAGLSDAILTWAPVAAEQALRVGSQRSAIRCLELALAQGDAAHTAQRASWLRRLSQCQHAVQHREASRQSLRHAIALLKGEGEGDAEAVAACRAQLALQLTPEPEALALAEQATAALAEGPATADQALAHAALAIALANLGRSDEALAQARLAEASAEASGDAEARLHAGTIAASVALSLAPSAQAFDRLQQCVQDAIDQRRSDRVGVPLINLASVSLVHADYERVLAVTAQGLAYCAERDLDMVRAHLGVRRALALLELARWDEARQTLAELLALPAPPAPQAGSAAILLARLDALQGRAAAPASTWQEHLEVAESGRTDLIPAYVATAAVEAAWLRGDDADALARARAALVQSQGPWLVGTLRQWVRRIGGTLPAPTGTALMPAHAAAEAGDLAGAHRLWSERGCRFEAALALIEGDSAQRRQALAELLDLGASAAADRLRRELQAEGVQGLARGPYGHARHDPLGLTRRERQVAQWLAEGLSNAQIAQQLHRSPRTVGHHVSAVLAKLGLASRAQVAQALAEGHRRRDASSPASPPAISSSDDGSGTGGSAP